PLTLQRRIHRTRIPKRTPTTPKQPPPQTPPNSSSPQPSSRYNKPGPSKPSSILRRPYPSAGGNILAHASTHRVMLKKASQGLRVAKIIDSPYLPESETYFQITAKGVEDAAPKTRRDE